jgi:uncharacterized membrane protein
MASNVGGLLAYILGPITGTIFLIIEPHKHDKFVRFHAFQSIFYSLAAYAVWSVVAFVISLLSWATFGLGGLLTIWIWPLLGLVFFVYWLFLLYKAYSNERYMIPVVGKWAATASEAPPTASNVNGFLSYVLGFITGLIFLLSESYKQDKFVRFHALQSIFFSAALFVLWMIYMLFIIGMIFTGGIYFVYPLTRVIGLGVYGYYLLLMSKAWGNEMYKVPVLGDLAAKQAG